MATDTAHQFKSQFLISESKAAQGDGDEPMHSHSHDHSHDHGHAPSHSHSLSHMHSHSHGKFDDHDDDNDVGYVYLRRPGCTWCPAICFSCCFRKAKLTNATLAVAKPGEIEEESDEESDEELGNKHSHDHEDDDGGSHSDDDHGDDTQVSSDATTHLLRKESSMKSGYGAIRNEEDIEMAEGVNTGKSKSKSKSKKEHSKSKRKRGKDAVRVFKLVFLCAMTAFAGVFNNLMFVKMGLAMSGYPAFLLYFTTLLYVVIYFLWLWLRRKSQFEAAAKARTELNALGVSSSSDLLMANVDRARVKQLQELVAAEPQSIWNGMQGDMGRIYWFTGFLVTVGGACSQFADPHVSGSLQAIINQLTLPLTALCIRFLLKHTFSFVEVVGATIVFIGSVLPIIPVITEANMEISQLGSAINKPFWVFIFLLSDIPSALVNVLEEIAFSKYKADEIHYLAFTNLLTLVGYLGTIPLDKVNPGQDSTLAQHSAWKIQEFALACFFGQEVTYTPHGATSPITGLPPACEPSAWLPVIGFVLCFVIYFYVSAVVVKHESAAFQALASTLVTPLSAIAFSSVWIMGAYAKPLDALTILAIFIVPVGIVIYKWEDVAGEGREDIIPLIARH